jgi:hypothetical protein
MNNYWLDLGTLVARASTTGCLPTSAHKCPAFLNGTVPYISIHLSICRVFAMPPTESTPNKRARTDKDQANGDLVPSSPPLPPLSLSILGTEPLDEFIFDVADFIHHMITSRPNEAGNIEVEAKIGVMKDRISGRRLALPVRVETSAVAFPLAEWASLSLGFPLKSSLRAMSTFGSSPTCLW